MKTRTQKDSILKALLIISGITFGFASLNNCDAQSIVGKWHRTGTTQFRIDKATGKETPLFTAEQQKQYDQASDANEYNEQLEFKSNNTYVSKVSAKGSEPTEHTEKYSITGNILDMNIQLVHNEKTTITIKSLDATTMIWDLVFMNKLTRITYKRI
jgi:SepF-like predicted cell division protein (DUF552 family)